MHLAHNCTPVEVSFDDINIDYNICSKGRLTVSTPNPFTAILIASNLAEKQKRLNVDVVELLEFIADESEENNNDA